MTKRAPQPAEENAVPTWMVLVYFAGDNNLAQEMVWGLQELTKASAELDWAKDKIVVRAQFDPGGLRTRRYDILGPDATVPSPPAPDGILNPTVVRAEGRIDVSIRDNPLLQNLSSPARAALAFIRKQLEISGANANHHLIVLSGHGSGAEGDFLMDDDPTTELTIPELGLLLREARRAHWDKFGRSSDRSQNEDFPDEQYKRIDILGMDSCLMSNVEVCYEVRNSVDYLVASEGFVENTGWPYHRVLQTLKQSGDSLRDDASVVAEEIARAYSRFYRDYQVAGVSTDIAACRLMTFRQSGGLIAKLEELAKVLIQKLEACVARRRLEVTLGTSDGKSSDDRREAAGRRLKALAAQIGELLEDASLPPLLEAGSNPAAAKDLLNKGRLSSGWETLKWNHSLRAALRELHQSLTGSYTLPEQDSEKELETLLDSPLWKDPTHVSDPAVAYAFVRVFRELDPGVQAALSRIETHEKEALDGEGDSRTKQARELLLELHHIREALELAEFPACKGGLTPDDQDLLNALVAARFEAQSFKGSVYVDLADFCTLMHEKVRGIANAGDVPSSLASAIIESFRTGADSQHAHGLSVFFPVAAADYTPKYANLQFAKDTGWARLVRAYLEATRRPRRNEAALWSKGAALRRYEPPEVDPLRPDGIEARIVGVIEGPDADGGDLVGKIGRGGGSNSAKGGGSNSAKGGGSNSAKGKWAAIFGNKPDGFWEMPISSPNEKREG